MKTKLLMVISLLLFGQEIFAQRSTYKAGTIIRIDTQDTLYYNVYAIGQIVEVMGYLDNDLYSASRHFILNGNIMDDAIVAGQIVSVYGHIGDMLMTAGQTVVVDGVIEGDLFAAGQEVQISKNAIINGNAFIAGGSILFEGGVIEGNLRTAGGELSLNGSVNGFSQIYSNEVTFGERYSANYGTTITSSDPIHRENLGAIPDDLTLVTEDADIWGLLLFQLWFFFSLLITGLIVIRLFQKTTIDIYRFTTEEFWKNTGFGIITLVAVPIAIVMLGILVVTIPLSILLALSYILALFAGYVIVAVSLGVMSILYFKGEATTATYYWGYALGMVYIAILTNLPFIGGVLNILLLLFGLGSITRYLWKLNLPGHASDSAQTREAGYTE